MRKLTFFTLIVLLFLAACNKEAGANQSSEEPEKSETDEREKPVEEEKVSVEPNDAESTHKDVFPLTGEPADDPIDTPIVSVMVNNHTKARPQSGLSQADLVYEVLAEGQITRFLALFQSEIPDTIGPVRSARPYYFELADGHDALYVYHGASTAINQQVANSGVRYLNGAIYDNNGWLFQRSSDRAAPHNSYLLTDGIDRAVDHKSYETTVNHKDLPFKEDSQLDGNPVDDVTIAYSNSTEVSYSYDEENEQFLRSSDGEPTIDRANNERIAVENIFVIKTDHQIIDNVGRRDIDLTSGGDAYLLQKGQLKEVQWKNIDGQLLPFEDGEPLSFTPGHTWVNIIPKNATVQTSNRSN
ncbi:DUF3048 domain-containing protein [Halobacillus litoralis]|uniref:DUF3048 domain-containing protein n=1 Tax=Halobacillus litoralis TaxID=45668 RepID=A0A410MBQ0_9BACI|nr:DUF3048 domain-containing protein [Halobacillus litoralis]QAS52127.1 DUF3048 domain-containing protein [Halobacillus litoralis]